VVSVRGFWPSYLVALFVLCLAGAIATCWCVVFVFLLWDKTYGDTVVCLFGILIFLFGVAAVFMIGLVCYVLLYLAKGRRLSPEDYGNVQLECSFFDDGLFFYGDRYMHLSSRVSNVAVVEVCGGSMLRVGEYGEILLSAEKSREWEEVAFRLQ